MCSFGTKSILKGLTMQKIIFLITLLLVLVSGAYADCQHNGKWYAEGAIMGPYICVNGAWIRR